MKFHLFLNLREDLTLYHHLAFNWFWCHTLVNLGIYWIRCDQVLKIINNYSK